VPAKGNVFGGDLRFKEEPKRKLVIRFRDSDFPVGFSRKLGVLLSVQEGWYLVPQIAAFPIPLYDAEKLANLKHHLVQEMESLLYEDNDLFVVGASGEVIVHYDHLFMDDGLHVYLQNLELADTLLTLLKESGANVESISNTP